MLVIPAIDIYDEKIVRLTKGDFDNITYYKNTPIQQAQLYESFGFKLVHVVDLTGSKTGKLTSLESVRKIKSLTKLEIEFGGGIRDVKSVADILSAGVDYAIIINEYTSSKIIAAIDVIDEKLRISGWTESTAVSVFSHIEYCSKLGIQRFLCTDISKDGTLIGTNVGLYKKIMDKYPQIKLIASGGVKDLEEIEMLNELNLYGVVVGKAIYENKIDLKELAKFAV